MTISKTIATTNYVTPGTFIGEIVVPQVSAVPEDSLVPCYVGKGSRLMAGNNTAIRRSYVYEENLTFPSLAPYRAVLQNYSDGNMEKAVLYTNNGIEIPQNQWRFISTGGVYNMIEINNEIFDPTVSYIVDYQSTSFDIPDILPIQELRAIINVGEQQDTSQYVEYTHYYIGMDITGPTATTGTPHISTIDLSTVTDISPSGVTPATASLSGSVSTYNDIVNREYQITVTDVSAAGLTFVWENAYADFTYGSLPAIPYHQGADTRTVSIAGIVNGVPNTVALSNGISFTITTTTAAASGCVFTGNVFSFSVGALPRFEKDLRYTNTNQFPEIGGVVAATGNTGTAVISINEDSEYTGIENANYHLYCYHVSGVNHAWVAWQRIGQYSRTSGYFHVDHTSLSSVNAIALNSGVYLNCASGTSPVWFGLGDTYSFAVKAPKIFYQGKDDRDTRIVVTVATAAGTTGTNSGYASANTPEGNYESFTVNVDSESALPEDLNGMYVFKNNMITYFKNLYVPWNGSATNRFTGGSVASADNWLFQFRNTNYIYWDLNAKKTENINSTDINSDVFGNITGTPNTKYIILEDTPVSITGMHNVSGESFILNTDYFVIANTSIVYFANTTSTNAKLAKLPIEVTYIYRSAEPNPGDLYYITANYLRPDNYYNEPILLTSKSTAREFLAPAATDNDLYIMSEIAWENDVDAFYIVQVKDSDGDGVYSNLDYHNAIDATVAPARIADIVVLNKWSVTSYLLQHINQMSDPFKRRHRLGWFGMPKDTPIGTTELMNSLVYTSKRTLQVYGDTTAHGTRILVGSTYGKREIQLQNNVVAEVTVDGSFVAGALAAMTTGFNSPATTILHKYIGGFTFLQTYGDIESIENNTLGNANIIYFTDRGSGVYRIEEDYTVDTYSDDIESIMNMQQKQYVTRTMVYQLTNALVGTVTPSSEAGVILLAGKISEVLNSLIAEGIIAQYQDEDGNVRDLSHDLDIDVWADTSDKTKLHFVYAYYLQGVIKRLFGVYTVDKNLKQIGVK